jgi:dUTP pyrophosphatase
MIGQSIDVEVKGSIPTKGSKEATGYDIRLLGAHTIMPGQSVLLPSQTSVSVPENVICFALPRSGITKLGLIMTNSIGLIDPDYLGIIHFAYLNIKDEPVELLDGERLGQLTFIASLVPNFIPVEEFSKQTERGENGFGHSGRV